MASPTSITVAVDSDDYSQYEPGKDTITASVVVRGGAPYVSEPIIVDLVKSRRSRDAVVASALLVFDGTTDPQEGVVTFYLPDLVDQDLISLIRRGSYFVRAYSEAVDALAPIGSGTNGTVSILTLDPSGTAGNVVTVEVIIPGGTSPLLVTRTGDAVLVSLATNAGIPIPTANTAFVVSSKINTMNLGIMASYSGTGGDSLTLAEGPITFSGGTDLVSAETPAINLRVVSVEKFRKDYLFGIPLIATNVKAPKRGLMSITGVSIIEVSAGIQNGFANLSYGYTTNDTADASRAIGSGTDGVVTITSVEDLAGSAGNAVFVEVVAPTAGTSALSVTYAANTLTITLAVIAGTLDATSNTATLVAAAIDALADFTAVASGTGATAFATDIGPLQFAGGTTDTIRTLSWGGGPLVSITGPGVYILQAGGASTGPAARFCSTTASNDYICVRVTSTLSLPTMSVTEAVLIEPQKLDDDTLGRYLDKAIDYIENDLLTIYIEPTNIVTDRDPTTIQFAAGLNAPTPIFTDTDFDFLVSPLTYFIPQTPGAWINIWTPYKQLLRVDSLYGSIANTRVIDIDLEWIEIAQQGGFIQLVPFNQEIAFDFIGLVNGIRGSAELPNFWHFNMIAGLRKPGGDIIELISKIAAIEALTMIAAAFRPGMGSMSLSRDGVSESVSYNTTQQYGIFNAAISTHREWIDSNTPRFLAKYRGMNWAVL